MKMNKSLEIKFKKLSDEAVLPYYSSPGDAGLDVTTITDGELVQDEHGTHFIEYDTGIAVAIPEGFVGFLCPRSSISNIPLGQANSIGIIDSSYRGSIKMRFRLDGLSFLAKYGASRLSKERLSNMPVYKKGHRIGQLIILPFPTVIPVQAKALPKTKRGVGGFGSTGK